MIRIIGNRGCSRCIATKNDFAKKLIEFKYELIENLPQEEQDQILKLAEESGVATFPILLDEYGKIFVR